MSERPFVPTIRRRLLLLLLAPLSVLLAVGVVFDYASGTSPVRDAYDQALANTALGLAARVRITDTGAIESDLPPQAIEMLRADKYDEIYYLVLGPHGEFVAGDSGLPLAPTTRSNPAFRDAQFNGTLIRVCSYQLNVAVGAVTVSVAETLHKRNSATQQMLTGIILTDTLQFIAILVLVWLGVRYGLHPLLALRDQIAERSARDLAALNETRVPGEVRPLTRALNRLFATVREAAFAQQRFVANAAHQLRTPLAGLQAQLELLADDPEAGALRSRLGNIHDGARRVAHTANQLLALARADSSANATDDFRTLDLRELCEDVVAEQYDRALLRELDLGVEAESARVHGSAWLLRELLVNLVDNAISYTPARGRITVRCGVVQRSDDAPLASFLEVEDDGPGIPKADRVRVLERFYRAPGARGDGTGLGLAIVDEIARAHAATLEIDAGVDDRGTRIRIRFPTVISPLTEPAPSV
jgi:two-component system, OmpR family, sensor histidine kinase TctE